MFTKLEKSANPDQITFFTGKNDTLRNVLAHVNIGKQVSFLDSASKLYKYAIRMGFEDVKLTSTEDVYSQKRSGRDRVITLQRVVRNEYKIVIRPYGKSEDAQVDHFTGTNKEFRKHLRDLHRNGMHAVRSEIENVAEIGFKIGSSTPSGRTPYSFGTIWLDRIECQPRHVGQLLKAIVHQAAILSGAKDDLLEMASMKIAA